MLAIITAIETPRAKARAFRVVHRKRALWKKSGADGIIAGNNPINGVDPDGMWFGDAPGEYGTCSDDASLSISSYQGTDNSVAHSAFLEGWSMSFGNYNGSVTDAFESVHSNTMRTGNEWGAKGNAASTRFSLFSDGLPTTIKMNYGPTDEFGIHGHAQPTLMSVNKTPNVYGGGFYYRGDLANVVSTGIPLFMVNSTGAVYYTNPELAPAGLRGSPSSGQVQIGNVPR